jgi:hypothetical protein
VADNAEKQGFKEEYIGGDPSPTYYSNNVRVTVTPWDLRFRFTQIDEIKDGTITYREVATVYLSPGQARAVFKILKDKMDTYEHIWNQQPRIIDNLGKESA